LVEFFGEFFIGLLGLGRDYIADQKWPRWKQALGCFIAVPVALIVGLIIFAIIALIVGAMKAALH
jgi:hypothetical protein